MRKIMACVDIGSDSVKCVVGEMVKRKLNVLAVADAPSKGVKNGIVEEPNVLLDSLRNVIQKCEEVIGLKIRQVIVSVPATNASFQAVSGTVEINNEGNLIEGKDVMHVLQVAIKHKKPDDLEYISMMPLNFALDDNRKVKDPKGLTSKVLSVCGVMVSTPKKNVYPILACLERLEIDVVDISLGVIGDYFEYKTKNSDQQVCAVVNVGDETTTMAIFNKGVLTNASVNQLGGRNIDNDISFIYKVPLNTAKNLKENFALATIGDSILEEDIEVSNKTNEKIKISQKELSEVVKSRLDEILNFSKKEINHLTKNEISYIILTGGLTELKNFKDVLEEIYGSNTTLGKIMEIGVRHNKYSSCLGLLKYYAYYARLKDKDYSIFSIEEQQELSGANFEVNDSVIGKLFGYIFNG